MAMRRFLLFSSIWFSLLASSAVQAHELRTEIVHRPPVILVTASYGGQEPLPYAPIDIFEPGASRVEFQNGRTDALGRFAFIPHRPGEWRIVVDDELGHHRETTVVIDPSFLDPDGAVDTSEPAAPAVPIWWRWLTGLSLIIGCTGIAFWLKARRRFKENS
jgi:nickel transport protein